MEYQRNFPTEIVFATSKYSGIGFLHLKAEHAVNKINFVLKHMQCDNSVGITLAITLRWAQ
eukprot:7804839-Ditylum_brightwellii.AAC.1